MTTTARDGFASVDEAVVHIRQTRKIQGGIEGTGWQQREVDRQKRMEADRDTTYCSKRGPRLFDTVAQARVAGINDSEICGHCAFHDGASLEGR